MRERERQRRPTTHDQGVDPSNDDRPNDTPATVTTISQNNVAARAISNRSQQPSERA